MTSVLITRPIQQAQKTAQKLQSLGIPSVIDPMLTVEYLPVTIDPDRTYQAILVTSAHAVPALQHFQREQVIYTVGDATATAIPMQQRIKSAHGTAQDLASLVEKEVNPHNGSLLYISGRTIHFDLVGHLTARGFSIDRLIAYDTHPATDFTTISHHLLNEGLLECILFYSRRTAQTFAKIIQAHKIEHCLENVDALTLSEEVAKPLFDLPFKKINVANEPTEAALIEKLHGDLFGKRRNETKGTTNKKS